MNHKRSLFMISVLICSSLACVLDYSFQASRILRRLSGSIDAEALKR